MECNQNSTYVILYSVAMVVLNWNFSLFFDVCISSRKNLDLLFSWDLNLQFLGL